MRLYTPKTDAEIDELARDIYAGLVFIDRYCNSAEEIQMAFMPLALADEEFIAWLRQVKIDMIYEYYSKAGPRTFNRNPVFFSMNLLDEHDAARVIARHDQIKAAVESLPLPA